MLTWLSGQPRRGAAQVALLAALVLCLSACTSTVLSPHPAQGESNNDGGNNGNNAGNNGGNNGGGNNTPRELPPFEPAPATLHRLTAEQYRASVRALLGVEVTTALEVDTPLHGYVSVSASELTIPPLAAEQYEEAAWSAALEVVGDDQRRRALVGCDVGADPQGCTRAWLARFGPLVWRRPLSAPEIDQIVAVATQVGQNLRDPWQGVAASIALLLQSPHFLFRVELGQPDPDNPGWLLYTDYEMASRLSFFLWGTGPDQALLDAAARGELTDDEGLRAQAARMLDDPRAQQRLSGFFQEYIGLERLETATKDAELFPQVNARLREAMRQELLLLFHELVFETEGDFRELLTTEVTYVDPALAALYGIEHQGDGTVRAQLPPGRGGLAGRAALLTIFSHATLNSPTLRGRFVRARLLCQDIPPPPEGVVASLEDEGGPGANVTLRDKLAQHSTDPACIGCHTLMDPIGFTLEHYDPIGQRRELDNGLPIDATAEIDGVPVDGAQEMGRAVAEHPQFFRCVARQLYRHAVGHLEDNGEARTVEALAQDFAGADFSFKALVRSIVLSDGFRKATAPGGGQCEADGQTRPCRTACGDGVERCQGGQWLACDAPRPGVEDCNGVDDDCDGAIDEELARACEGGCGGGIQSCEGGQWGACQIPAPPAETCNDIDDDCDGQIDEDLAIDVHAVPFSTLTARHDGCTSGGQRRGPECNAAINRHCGGRACSATGFGPVGTQGAQATVACLDATQARTQETRYSVLINHHGGCNGSSQRLGPDCNAAIHRFCASQGLTSGFGPLENNGDLAYVACTPAGQVIQTSYTALGAHNATCTAGGQRIGPQCDDAIHRHCQAQGFLTGFGPVENSGDVAVITCLRP